MDPYGGSYGFSYSFMNPAMFAGVMPPAGQPFSPTTAAAVDAMTAASAAATTTATGPQEATIISNNNNSNSTTTSSNNMKRKLPSSSSSARASPVFRTTEEDETLWRQTVLAHIPRCAAKEGIRDSSVFRNQSGNTCSNRQSCLKKLLMELSSMDEQESLPSYPAIWLRFDEETPQFLRALITAPSGTPYSHGLFCFDIFVPDQYPNVPPKVKLLTTGKGTCTFSPNLYANGTVCLSLLGTWSGPKWNPLHSSLLQVLVSIQGLILGVEHPYFLEPGHGGWGEKPVAAPFFGATSAMAANNHAINPYAKKKTKTNTTSTADGGGKDTGNTTTGGTTTNGTNSNVNTDTNPFTLLSTTSNVPAHVKVAEDRYREGTIKFALLEPYRCRNANYNNNKRHYLMPFDDIIAVHFEHYKDAILYEAKEWAATAARHGIKVQMEQAIGQLEQEFEKYGSTKTKQSKVAAKDDASDATKPAPMDTKQAAMEEAARKGDYIQAAQYQRELQYLQGNDTVGTLLQSKRQRMEEAAQKRDYITAGNLQQSIQHMETFQKRLKELQRLMYEAAAKEDFVRAGNFQEQYQVLMEDLTAEEDGKSSTTTTTLSGSKPTPAMMWDQSGMHPAGPFPPMAAAAAYGGDPYYDDPYYDDAYDY